MKTKFIQATLACITFTAAPLPSAAQSDEALRLQSNITAEIATRKVNIAGRQRMLSQRMAKAACLMSQDVSFGTAFDQMTSAYNLFVVSDNALRHGNADMGLPAETIERVIGSLSNIDQHWLRYRIVIENSLDSGQIQPADLTALDVSSLQVLKFMNLAVFQTARAYGSVTPDLSLEQTITVDVAGRQRMLTQRAVKEACMMRIASDPETYAVQLAETVQLFDLSLTALLVGYDQAGVIAAPTLEIENKLNKVREFWEPIKDIMDQAAAGKVLDDAEMALLASKTEPLLATMNDAVGLYEKVHQE